MPGGLFVPDIAWKADPGWWLGHLSKPSATSNLNVKALKHPPKITPVAAPALIFRPSRTGLRYGLITEVIRGLGASGVISTKQIAMSLCSLCEQGQRGIQRAGGCTRWLYPWINNSAHNTLYSNVTK